MSANAWNRRHAKTRVRMLLRRLSVEHYREVRARAKREGWKL